MAAHDFVPRRKSLFNLWQENLLAYIDPRRGGWNITDQEWTPLTALQTAWRKAYERAENPETRTHAAIVAKYEALNTYTAAIRLFLKATITYNPAVTDADRANMGLTVRDPKPTPPPPPETAPIAEVDFSEHQRHSLRVKDSAMTGRTKPEGVRGFEAWSSIGTEPATDGQFTYAGFSSNNRLVVDYPLGTVGQTVWYRFRWINTRNESGPWSETISAVVA
jgi:hypothetical protein